MYKAHIKEIEKVQRRATKLVKPICELDYPERLKALNLTTLTYRRMRTDILQVFRIFKGFDKLDYRDFFELSETGLRGHKWKLKTPTTESRLRQNSFSCRVINTWNSL